MSEQFIPTQTPTDQERRWKAVLQRDPAHDGKFVYAVKTTAIYCRPSCPSRKPKRKNALLFPLPELAEQAGFRPCKRCQPHQIEAPDPHIQLSRDICQHIQANLDQSLTLEALSKHFHVSPHHLQRTFKSVVGISPQQYTEACRMQSMKTALGEGQEITSALYQSGYNSNSRLYTKAAAHLGMTPKRYQRGGKGEQISFSITRSSLGYLLVAATSKGICAVRLGDNPKDLKDALHSEFPNAAITPQDEALNAWVKAILQYLQGQQPHLDLPLDIQATAFQKQVWQALQKIPYGETLSYSQVANSINRPKAVRAVANACASNPVALIIPCHRVIRSNGEMGGYRWGIERKRTLLQQEKSE